MIRRFLYWRKALPGTCPACGTAISWQHETPDVQFLCPTCGHGVRLRDGYFRVLYAIALLVAGLLAYAYGATGRALFWSVVAGGHFVNVALIFWTLRLFPPDVQSTADHRGILYGHVLSPSELRARGINVRDRRPGAMIAFCVVVGLATAVFASIWLGPFLSGGLFLSWPPLFPAPTHGLPEDYRPWHRGHVDLATGLYVREDEDLVLAGDVPFALKRTYLSGDRVSRHFGIGTTHNGEWYLIANPADFSWAELIRADGSRVRFDRISHGNSYVNAMFRHHTTATEFYGARLGWTGFDWVVRFQNGSRTTFQDCGPYPGKTCSVVELKDPDSHAIRFQRDAAGTLLRIQTPHRAITLEYDARKRIVAARDDLNNGVNYTYDALGRLVRVTSSDGIRRTYTYGPHDELLTIDEPGWLIENTYDGSGRRVIRQVAQMRDARGARVYDMKLAYKLSGDSVIETDATNYDGTHTVYRFDAQGHTIEEVYDAESGNPVTVAFERSSGASLAHLLTVSCRVDNRLVTGSATVDEQGEDQTKAALIQTTCRQAAP